jgi:hypothetical protein
MLVSNWRAVAGPSLISFLTPETFSMNRQQFFAAVRTSVFGGALKSSPARVVREG